MSVQPLVVHVESYPLMGDLRGIVDDDSIV
jgi:hypothetical protein